VEVVVDLAVLPTSDASVGAGRALPGFDLRQLVIQPIRFLTGDPAVTDPAIDAIADLRFAFVDVAGSILRAIVLLHGDETVQADRDGVHAASEGCAGCEQRSR